MSNHKVVATRKGKQRLEHLPQAYRAVGLALMLLLSGCAGPSREQCETIDWYATGWETGEQGVSSSEFDRLASACAEYGVDHDRESFEEGYDEGISRYCTYDKGAELGRRGNSYPTVCPEPYSETFKAGYDGGMTLYCTPQTAYELGVNGSAFNANCLSYAGEGFREAYDYGKVEYEYVTRVRALESELDYLDRVIRKKERRLINDTELTDAERREVIAETREAKRRYQQARRDLQWLRWNRPVTRTKNW